MIAYSHALRCRPCGGPGLAVCLGHAQALEPDNAFRDFADVAEMIEGYSTYFLTRDLELISAVSLEKDNSHGVGDLSCRFAFVVFCLLYGLSSTQEHAAARRCTPTPGVPTLDSSPDDRRLSANPGLTYALRVSRPHPLLPPMLRSLSVSLLSLRVCPACVPCGPRPLPPCMGIAACPLRRLRPFRPFPPFQGLLCLLALLALSKAHLRVSS
jgi:hypothetical protein